MASKYLLQVDTLDALVDHQRIVRHLVCYEFPFDITRALEFALFRTYAVPSISKLLDATGEFYARPQKRYDDTDLIVSLLLQKGYDSPEGKAALRRMNQMHGRFDITNDDFLYVLSTFVFEPIKWNARFGWRPMHIKEQLALFHCWRAIGKHMNIEDIPDDIAEFRRWSQAYEQRHFVFDERNHRVGEATVTLFLSWFPALLRPLGRQAIYALMEERLLDAFGFPHPSRITRQLVTGSLKTLALFKRLTPPRRRPKLRDYSMKRRSYSQRYTIDDVGPPYMTQGNADSARSERGAD